MGTTRLRALRETAGTLMLLLLVVTAALAAGACTKEKESAAPPPAAAPAESPPAGSAPADPQPAPVEPVPAEPQQEPAAEPVVTVHYQPIPIGPLESGTTYATSAFDVPLTLTATAGWKAYGDFSNDFEILSADEDHGLLFFHGDRVAVSSFPQWPPAMVTGAPGWSLPFANWFAEHRYLEGDEPQPAVLDGIEGYQVETVTKGYHGDEELCDPCAPLFWLTGGSAYLSKGGQQTRWYMVDVDGRAVVIGAWAESAKVFDESIDEMEAVVQSLDLSPDLEPIPLGPLGAGTTYATWAFAVPLTLSVPAGWKSLYIEHWEEFELHSVNEDHGLVFFGGSQVVCSFAHWPAICRTDGPGAALAWARWFAEHPYLAADEPQPAVLGGVEGSQVETVTKGYHGDEELCDPCAPLFWLTSPTRNAYLSQGGQQTRWYMVDVDGRAFVVGAWAASPRVFDESIDEMEEVLKTMKFASA